MLEGRICVRLIRESAERTAGIRDRADDDVADLRNLRMGVQSGRGEADVVYGLSSNPQTLKMFLYAATCCAACDCGQIRFTRRQVRHAYAVMKPGKPYLWLPGPPGSHGTDRK
jgi:hypothetical protein